MTRVRILADDVKVYRYGMIRAKILSGVSASKVAGEVGISRPALLDHLKKMGLTYSDARGWEDSLG
jgi:hypothetical protein